MNGHEDEGVGVEGENGKETKNRGLLRSLYVGSHTNHFIGR